MIGQFAIKMEQLHREKMEQLDKEMKLTQEIFTDPDYDEIFPENTDIHDKIKKIILKHGLVKNAEINVFVRRNINSPEIQEIFNDFKGKKDSLRNIMKKYGVTDVEAFIPNLIYFEFVCVNDYQIEQKER